MTIKEQFNLEGKVAIITGSSKGIGKAIAKGLAENGAQVVISSRSQEACDVVVAEFKKEGLSAIGIACHIGKDDQRKQLISKTIAAFGRIDILVNNAANDDRHDWQNVTPEYWDERLSTNLRHQFFAIQHVAPGMIKKGGGSIINMGSNSWWEAGGGFPAYATAKSAVHGLTRTMARDLGQHRIRVNTVVPGWIMTERQKTLWVTPEGLENQYKRQCLPDLIDPIYVARMVLFLASDDASMCTANNYMVEAGSI